MKTIIPEMKNTLHKINNRDTAKEKISKLGKIAKETIQK